MPNDTQSPTAAPPITNEMLDELERIIEAAMPKQTWERHGLTDLQATETATALLLADRNVGEGSIWYGDGDQAAYVYDNLGLSISGVRVATLMVAAVKALPSLIADIRRLRKKLNEVKP